MTADDEVIRLVARIYDAAADPSRWPVFLESFADTVGATATAIVHHDLQEMRGNVNAAVRFDPVSQSQYNQHFVQQDPWRNSWRSRFRTACPEGILTSGELVEPSELTRTSFFQDYLRPQDTVHQFGGAILLSEGRFASAITSLRPDHKGPFDAESVRLLRALFPHLQRALQFHKRMLDLEGQKQAFLNLLELLPTGVILMDSRREICHFNRSAGQILNAGDGLSIRKKGLVSATPGQTKTIGVAVTLAARTSAGDGLSAGESFAVARPSGKRSYTLLVMPLSRVALPPEAQSPAAIVFVSDSEQESNISGEHSARLYGFTRAERRVVDLLMQGESLSRASEILGISHNTTRTHLQRIFGKTGVRHQGELIKVLLVSVPQLVSQTAETKDVAKGCL